MIIRRSAAVALAAFLTGTSLAQTICPPQPRWQHTFGTSGYDHGKAIVQMQDGGFVVGGYSRTDLPVGNRTSPIYGYYDVVLVRLDEHGQKVWDKSYGGTQSDYLFALEGTTDGGLIFAGKSFSEPSGNKSSPHYGTGDFWIVRLDSEGNILWEKSYGGAGEDHANAIQQTADGGFIVGGRSTSGANGNKTSPLFGTADFWVVRLDAAGNKLWDGSFGGTQDDSLYSLAETPDGGFVLGGWSRSAIGGNKTAPRIGSQFDYWLVRLAANGSKLWDRVYGGESEDLLQKVLALPNGNIFLAGLSYSGVSSNKTVPSFGWGDFWVLELNPAGDILWQGAYGGLNGDVLYDAKSLGPNGFLLAGYSGSPVSGTKTSPLFRDADCWLVRIDTAGNQIWDGTYGGTRWDSANSVTVTADGGYAFVADSESTHGNKTSPTYGAYDMWVVKLRPENAADCDNDSVPNAQDNCADTLAGPRVNANGCAIEQLCPCDGWLDHSNYVACIERVSEDFRNAGVINDAERAEIMARAEAANCPPTVIAFGLRHVPIKDTIVLGGGEDSGLGFRSGTNEVYGATVLLGEADAGLFIDPGAEVWGYGNPEWFLDGKVYGRYADGSNGLIVTVRGTKPDIETYPVAIDFTPLGATGMTFQYFYNGEITNEETNDGPIGSITINTADYLQPRVNPFWRMSDGSVGVLIEFYGGQVGTGTGSFPYEWIFIRANGGRQVDYVSHIEVAGGGDLYGFSLNDGRLGVFRHRHHILGGGLFHATNRQLTLTPLANPHIGTLVEFERNEIFEIDFLPIDLAATDAALTLSFADSQQTWGWLNFIKQTNRIELSVDFDNGSYESNTVAPGPVEIKVSRNGELVGTCLDATEGAFGHLVASNGQAPQIIGYRATASSNAPPSIAFSTDRVATFVCTNGTELSGTHFRFAPSNRTSTGLMEVSVFLAQPSPLTILDERSRSGPTRLSIASTGDNIMLSWSDNTRLFRLESSPSLPAGFTPVEAEVDFANGRNIVTLPRENTGSRFFRLAQTTQ